MTILLKSPEYDVLTQIKGFCFQKRQRERERKKEKKREKKKERKKKKKKENTEKE